MYICALFFLGYHELMRHTGASLGAVDPSTAPLYGAMRHYAGVRPLVHEVLRAVVPLGIFAFAMVGLVALTRQNGGLVMSPIGVNTTARPGIAPTGLILSVAVVLMMAMSLSVALMRGPQAIVKPLLQVDINYFGDVGRVQGLGHFLHNYAHLAPTMSMHTATHPPGGVVFLYLISRIVGAGIWPAALSVTAFSALGVIPVYLLANRLYGSTVAILSVAMYIVTPSVALYGVATLDGVFAVFLVTCAYLFYVSLEQRPALFGALCGICLGISTFFTFAGVALVILFAVYLAMEYLTGGPWRRTFGVLSIAAGAFVLFFAAVYAASGYSIIDSVRVSIDKDARQMGKDAFSIGMYLNVSTANLVAFLIGAGVPSVVLWLSSTGRAIRQGMASRRWDLFLLSFPLTVVLLSFGRLFTLETERIWLFLLPFVVISAAKAISEHIRLHRRPALLYLTMALLIAQVLAMAIAIDPVP